MRIVHCNETLWKIWTVKVESGSQLIYCEVEDQGTLEETLLSEPIVLISKLINKAISGENILAAKSQLKIFSMRANWREEEENQCSLEQDHWLATASCWIPLVGNWLDDKDHNGQTTPTVTKRKMQHSIMQIKLKFEIKICKWNNLKSVSDIPVLWSKSF